MPLLEATEIHAGYGETEILHGVSIHLNPGEFVTIIGPNGAGKSTLVKTIIGLLKPRLGVVRYRDREITGLNPEELAVQGLAYIPQTSNTFPSLTVLENLEMGAITVRPGLLSRLRLRELIRGLIADKGDPAPDDPPDARGRRPPNPSPRFAKEAFEARVEHICTLFPNLRPKLRSKVHTLSGGEQQMVALARTLVLDPQILLVDEPSAGLAPRLVSTIFDKIQEINQHGVGIVLVEQNARKALSLADRGYVLEAGKNRYEGPGEALLHDPQVGALYLGG